MQPANLVARGQQSLPLPDRLLGFAQRVPGPQALRAGRGGQRRVRAVEPAQDLQRLLGPFRKVQHARQVQQQGRGLSRLGHGQAGLGQGDGLLEAAFLLQAADHVEEPAAVPGVLRPRGELFQGGCGTQRRVRRALHGGEEVRVRQEDGVHFAQVGTHAGPRPRGLHQRVGLDRAEPLLHGEEVAGRVDRSPGRAVEHLLVLDA